jgi:hypothetical protein
MHELYASSVNLGRPFRHLLSYHSQIVRQLAPVGYRVSDPSAENEQQAWVIFFAAETWVNFTNGLHFPWQQD